MILLANNTPKSDALCKNKGRCREEDLGYFPKVPSKSNQTINEASKRNRNLRDVDGRSFGSSDEESQMPSDFIQTRLNSPRSWKNPWNRDVKLLPNDRQITSPEIHERYKISIIVNVY